MGLAVSGLNWGSHRVELMMPDDDSRALEGQQLLSQQDESDVDAHRDLLEALDGLVAYEHYYHSVYGHFTQFLQRVGYSIPETVADNYEIRVVEATPSRLLVSAFSEVNGKTVDVASADQDYRVNANFPLPGPRPDYLRVLAVKHLRTVQDAPKDQPLEEQGVYRGYFKYSFRDEGRGRVAYAIGIKSPVLGMQVQSSASASEVLTGVHHIGQNESTTNPTHSLEEAYLAQRIFRAETGRYATNWNELAQIAHFSFNQNAPFGNPSDIDRLEVPEASASEVVRAPANGAARLEIEPIPADKN